MKYKELEQARDEEVEAKRNANMRLMLYSSMIFLSSIILIIIFYLLGLELDRQIALNFCYIGIIIVVISFITAYLKYNEGFLIATIGLCIIMIVASLGPGQALPVLFAMVCGFIIPFAVFLMMKFRYAERLDEAAYEHVKGGWEIDEQGYVRKAHYPMYWPEQSELKHNLYGLWICPPMGFGKKIGNISMSIMLARPRVREHEKKLIPHIKNVIQSEYDHETIEKNGGIDQIIKNIIWEEAVNPYEK